MTITRDQLERVLAPELRAISGTWDRTLTAAQVSLADSDSHLLTADSSQIPVVRALLSQRFGPERVRFIGAIRQRLWWLGPIQ
ncbi:MAG: hypothetical protein AB1331_08515 [Bacillota bacterium]